MRQSDNREIACGQDGDMELLSQVYARYETAVFLHAYYLLGRPEEADNVKQETFLHAFRAIDRPRDEASWKTWLLKTCTDLCREKPQRRHRLLLPLRRKQERLPAAPAGEVPIASTEQGAEFEILLPALRQMPLEPRNLIALSELEGYTPAEMAAIAGCAPEALASRLLHARRLFQKSIHTVLHRTSSEPDYKKRSELVG